MLHGSIIVSLVNDDFQLSDRQSFRLQRCDMCRYVNDSSIDTMQRRHQVPVLLLTDVVFCRFELVANRAVNLTVLVSYKRL